MRTLTTAEIIRIWELGQDRPSWQRALLLLAPCFPDARPSELGALPLARRNTLLLELRERTVGPVMHCFVLCPQCGAPLEFSATVRELLDRANEEPQGGSSENEFTLEVEGGTVSCRMLTTHDLAAAAGYLDVTGAMNALLLRSAFPAASPATSGPPSPAFEKEVEQAVSQAIERVAPLTDIRIPLCCASGEHIWAASLDIASFLWTEIDRIAARLLDGVQALARAYGWQESEILAMSDGRRKFYLEAIQA
jgi:hypothetical protein